MMGARLFKTVSCLLIIVLLLASCKQKPDEGVYHTLVSLHEGYTAVERGEIGFLMEASFADDESGEAGVLYFIQGNACYDREAQTAWQKYTATLLASTYNSEEYYADGVKKHIEGGEAYDLETAPEEFFDAFPYCRVPLAELSAVESLTASETDGGMLYTLVASAGQKELVEEIWKTDLYALAGIRVPDREKESYGDVTYTYSVKEGQVQSLSVKLTVSLYETAAYTPGYTPDEESLRLDLTLQAKVTLKQTGEGVNVPVYVEESS
ncbi:MAG: hypothetical protein E7651_01425 [Ruminococcaceae bacterium]|nr:hypothetical protein [Oscillospiraceae bacterium]